MSGINTLAITDQVIRIRPVSHRSGMSRWAIHGGPWAIGDARWAIHDRQVCRRADRGSLQIIDMSSHFRDTGCMNHTMYV